MRLYICGVCIAILIEVGSLSTGYKRTLIVVENRIPMANNLDYIIFPKYNESISNIKVSKVNKSNLYNLFITNIRYMKDIKHLYKDMNNILKFVPAYSVQYSDCADVYDWLKNLN